MDAKVTIQKKCPVTRATGTYGFDGRQLAALLRDSRPIELFCTSCAQLHTLDADERARAAAKLSAGLLRD
jgi:hypothetical protein